MEVMLWDDSRKFSLFFANRERENLWGVGGRLGGGDLRRENLVPYRGKFRKPTPVAAVSLQGAPGRWIRECQERRGGWSEDSDIPGRDRVDGKDLEC